VQLVVKNTGDERTKNLKVAVKIFKKEGYDWKEVAKCVSIPLLVFRTECAVVPGARVHYVELAHVQWLIAAQEGD
jgi:hypothetical protein